MGEIRKRETRLADGRELIYFDDADTALTAEAAPDLRELPPRPDTAEMRRDPLTGEWVSVAAARQHRVFLPPKNLDPLAPQSPTNPSEVPSEYDVAVFENRSPSFGPQLADEDATGPVSRSSIAADGHGVAARGHDPSTPRLGETRPSIGRCEVVCFSPEHEGSFASQTLSRARTVVEAWADRTRELSRLPGVEQVFVFENRGEAIGVTLHHPHGQIYAYPFITPRTANLIRQIEAYDGDLFGDLLAFEQAGPRVIARGQRFTLFVPFAARWPIELHLLPHRHVPDLGELTVEEKHELAAMVRRALRALDALYPTPTPYIAAWHQAPVHEHRDDVRLMLQITSPRRDVDKLKFLAGSESAMGAWVADKVPELLAEALRDVWQEVGE